MTTSRLPVLAYGLVALAGCSPAHEGAWTDGSRATFLLVEDGSARWTYQRPTPSDGAVKPGLEYADWYGAAAKTENGVTLSLTCSAMRVWVPDAVTEVKDIDGCEASGASSTTVPCTLDGDTLICTFDGEKTTLLRD